MILAGPIPDFDPDGITIQMVFYTYKFDQVDFQINGWKLKLCHSKFFSPNKKNQGWWEMGWRTCIPKFNVV